MRAAKPIKDIWAICMRAWLVALALTLLAAGVSTEAPATVLGCDKPNADPQYCHDKERRPICLANGRMVWKDTQSPLSQGEYHFLSQDGPVAMPKCP